MRIRTQLAASAAVAASVTVIVLAGLLHVTQRTEHDLEQQEQSLQMARHVANMLTLTSEVVAYGSERAAAQWRTRHAELLTAVDAALQGSAEPPPPLLQLRRSVLELRPLFDKLVQIPPDASGALSRRRRELLMERLLIETQEVGEARYAWAMTIVGQQRQNQRTYTAMVLAAPGALLLLLLALGLLVARRVLRPLARLRLSVAAIQGGDLNARCANDAADELGDAARAVDSMARSLQQQSAALRASEHRLRMITDNMPALVGHIDAEQRYTFANAHFARSGGGDPAAVIGRTMLDVRGEAVYRQVQPHVLAALSGREVTFETTRCGPDGNPVHRQSTYVPDVDDAGTVRGFYAMTFDVTARKDTELQLAASQRLLTNITDNMPALVAYIDSDQRYRFANSRHREWLGNDPAQMAGRSVQDVLGAARYEALKPRLVRALAGERVRWEGVRNRHGGNDTHDLVEYIPDLAADGSVRGCYVLAIDISDRWRAELAAQQSEQRMHELINAIPAVVGCFDMDERCLYANDAALRLEGLEREQLHGLTLRAALGDANYAQHEPFVKEALQGRRSRLNGKVPFAGREAYFQAHLIPQRVEGGAQRGFYLMTFDITALKEAEQRQARVERQLLAIADNLPVVIAHIGQDERYLFVNATFQHWIGLPAEQVLGRTVEEVVGAAEYDLRRGFLSRARQGERVEFPSELVTDGQVRHLHNIYVPDIQPDGTVGGIYALRTDVTALKQIEDHLSRLALVDALTGLANRRQFEQRMVQSLARASRMHKPLAVLFLDVDHFKRINDQHGHAVGDAVLKEFGARLHGTVRVTDMAARLAGDEFVVLLEALHDGRDAENVAAKIVSAMREPFHADGKLLAVSTSVGVAWCRAPGTDTDLLAHADSALYVAKAAGRNTFSACEVPASTLRFHHAETSAADAADAAAADTAAQPAAPVGSPA